MEWLDGMDKFAPPSPPQGGGAEQHRTERVYVQEQWFYKHEASGIKVWEHARLP